jgi:hypothetical protein
MTSVRMPPIRPRWTIVAKVSTTIAAALVTRHTPRRCSGEPINKRSLFANKTKTEFLRGNYYPRGPPWDRPDDTRIINSGGSTTSGHNFRMEWVLVVLSG